MARHATRALVHDRQAALVEGGRPQHDPVRTAGALASGSTLVLVLLRGGLLLEERQTGPVLAPREVTSVRLLVVAAHTGGGWPVVPEAGADLRDVELGEYRARAVPDLLNAPKAPHGHDVAEGLLQDFDGGVPPVG